MQERAMNSALTNKTAIWFDLNVVACIWALSACARPVMARQYQKLEEYYSFKSAYESTYHAAEKCG